MFHIINRLTLLLLISCVISAQAHAKKPKIDHLLVAENLVSEAYAKGYVDAAPVEMGFIEKKLGQARIAKDKRKKKNLIKLVEQIKVDLKIVKKRYEVNKLHQKLSQLQNNNLESKKMLDELKRQL